ncbi:hypothetical protein C4D60_Mb05t02620 [Musa balbisiana]|uniref:Uncharacterized protein n=1 Tax=Musa balbisiana TaxID=52838 RepID=A0A4S8JT89_MUSBA|nr:hypothetical protein C4D60_Mb05t02620 [Musa balbisiana]
MVGERVENRETEHYILLAIEAKGEEWVEVSSSVIAKEGEALGELVPRDYGVDSSLPLCFLSYATSDELLRLRDDKPWMGRFVAMACLSLVAKVEETHDPFQRRWRLPSEGGQVARR